MKAKTIHCEECMEEIPGSEMYWEDQRLYCGRCGGELEIGGSGDLLDEFSRRRITGWQPPIPADDDDDDDTDAEDDEIESDDDAWEDDDEDGGEKNGNGRRE